MCVIYVREDNDSKCVGYDYTACMAIWTPMSAVPQKPLNLISHSLGSAAHYLKVIGLVISLWASHISQARAIQLIGHWEMRL